ncbi:MAG: molybdopterin converting factor subunit 1 [Thermoanaerobaculia bacterium]
MKVRILLFAILRDIVGRDEIDRDLPDGSRASDLWRDLLSEFPDLGRFQSPPMVAVNQNYEPAGTELHDGDEVAFIPPVSGGH